MYCVYWDRINVCMYYWYNDNIKAKWMSVHHRVGSWEDRELVVMKIGPNNMLDLTILE